MLKPGNTIPTMGTNIDGKYDAVIMPTVYFIVLSIILIFMPNFLVIVIPLYINVLKNIVKRNICYWVY